MLFLSPWLVGAAFAQEIEAPEPVPAPEAGEEETIEAPEPVEPPINAVPKQRSQVSLPEPSQNPFPLEGLSQLEDPPGSLWQDGTGRQLLGLVGTGRRIGDLITVTIDEQSTSDLGATTTSNKTNERSGSIGGLFGLEASITEANPNLGGSIGFQVGSDANFTGGGNTSANVTVQATVTCTVVNVTDNGNLQIEGFKEVRNYKETQYVTVLGTVRPQDIAIDNTVSSLLLSEARIEILGQGSIAERNRPGVGTRVLDVAWPF